MEKKLLRYTLIIIIFFMGLSMGVSYQEQNRSEQLQDTLKSYEDEISQPGNDFTPVNPIDNSKETNQDTTIENNLFTGLAKDGEYILKKGLELILDKSDDFFRLIFGIK